MYLKQTEEKSPGTVLELIKRQITMASETLALVVQYGKESIVVETNNVL